MGLFEVNVFNDTRKKYGTIYKAETEELVNNGTRIYIDPIVDTQFMPHQKMPNKNMKVWVEKNGTVSAGKAFTKGRTAILNFADALVPGGLVLTGATTQEENICRCSNLYAALTSPETNREYYCYNALADAKNDLYPTEWRPGVYTDALIYTRDVLFYKDDNNYEDVEPYRMDVITCPAPSVKIKPELLEKTVIRSRIEKIVKAAILNKVDNLVLGAWGCGAFGQDPELISKTFMEVIKIYSAFDNVVFALRGCDPVFETGVEDENYKAFLDNCKL